MYKSVWVGSFGSCGLAWFRCVVVGENFYLPGEQTDDGPVLVGFEVVRCVEARDEHEAEMLVLAGLRADSPFIAPAEGGAEAEAVVLFDDIVCFDGPPTQPDGGFIVFHMDEAFADFGA